MRKQVEDNRLRLMVFSSAWELGQKVDEYLLSMYGLDKDEYTFIVPIKENFFEDGHLKVEILETVRGKDLFVLTDIGNYSLTYKMHGFYNHTSPNDLLMQLKDGIGACNCHAKHINIVMPLLYAGRQHRRLTRENQTCGMMLREFCNQGGIKSFITFDAHDEGVSHAVHNMEWDSCLPSNVVLERLINDLDVEDLKMVDFVAPDNGATGRNSVYLNSFNSSYVHRESGHFTKQRDYNRVVDGKNPITGHSYSGNADLSGYTAIVADDMISSGGSMFDVIEELHKRGVKKVIVIVTFALFTNGIQKFEEYYRAGLLSAVYTTNLSYIPLEYQQAEWLHVCDCSHLISELVYNIHNDISISHLLRDKSAPAQHLEAKFREMLDAGAISLPEEGQQRLRTKPNQNKR